MSTIIHRNKFEDDTSPLVSLEDVHMEVTVFKQEEPSPTTDQPLLAYTSAPIHPLTEGASLNSSKSSWENEYLRRSRRNSEGSSQSHLRSQVPVYRSSTQTEDQSLHATATSPPRHAQYERIPFGRMIGRRHHLMLRRGERGQSEWPSLIGGSAKVQKYQKVMDDRALECEEEEEQEQEGEREVEKEVSSEKQRKTDRVSALKSRRSWSGSLTSAFTFAPYQSF